MKKIKQKNNWIIKEKRLDEIPMGQSEDRKYCIFSPNGTFMEDNLTYDEAMKFCETNLDFYGGK